MWRKRRPYLRTRQTKRHLLWHFVYGGIAIAIVSLVLYGVWYVTRLSYFTISHVEVMGGSTVDAELVRAEVLKELSGNYAFLIPKRFTYFYPHTDIVARVQSIPRISQVEVVRSAKDTLTVTFSEYTPHALWCSGEEREVSSCIFLSQSGYAFATAPSLEGSAFIRYITEDREPETGTQLFEYERMQSTEAFIEALEAELGFRAHQVIITSADDVTYVLTGGGSILVTGTMSVQETFDNLHSVLASPEFSHLKPGEFEYIDLRFGSRVFVKEEVTVPLAKESATTTDVLPESE